METWTRRTYVCDSNACDAWLEITTKDSLVHRTTVTCPCGHMPNLVSEDNATITATNNERETMQNDELQEARNRINLLEQRVDYQEKTIGQVLQNLTAQGWYADSADKEDVLSDLCSIFDHEPKQTLTWSATITVEGTTDVPLNEVNDFDLRYFLNDDLSLDVHHGDTIVHSYYVNDIDSEEWS